MSSSPQHRPSRHLRETLQHGLEHHRAGRLADASACYAAILAEDPGNSDALQLSGVIARQQGDLERSEQLIAEAIRRLPAVATYHHNLARTYERQGKLVDAEASFRRALSLNPRDADSMQILAKLLALRGEIDEATRLYQRAISIVPDRSENYFFLGAVLRAVGKVESALIYYRRAAELGPESPDAHFQLAETLSLLRRFREAIPEYERALELRPDHPETLNSLGRAHHEIGELRAAGEAYLRAINLRPNYTEPLSNMGALYMDLGNYKPSEIFLRKVIELNPNHLNAHSNLGTLLSRMGDERSAEAEFNIVLAQNPTHVPTLCSLGFLLDTRGDEAGAARCFRKALELQPDSPVARFNISPHLLIEGNFAEGWAAYEKRWEVLQFARGKRHLTESQWRGEPLAGKRIFLYAEQGFGDTLQFVRYLPLLAARGATVTLEVQPPLLNLLRHVEGAHRVIATGAEPTPAFDFQCPLLSLPLAFQTDLQTIPARIPYLFAEPEKAAQWTARLAGDTPGVGIVWSGNPLHTRDRLRSIPLEAWREVLAVKGIRFFSLQKGPAAAQLEAFPGIENLDDELRDFTDTAAVIANLDLVLCVDTAVAHLAGALGKPVWLLINHAPDWRWLRSRTDSPWYPTFRLYRQTVPGQWSDVLEKVRIDLEGLAG